MRSSALAVNRMCKESHMAIDGNFMAAAAAVDVVEGFVVVALMESC